MAFYFDNNEQQKVRMSLSQRTYETITEDMQIFGYKQHSGFINDVMENFRETALASLDRFQERRMNELKELLRETINGSDSSKELIKELIKKETEIIELKLKNHLKERGPSRTYYVNNENVTYLTKECSCECFYGGVPGRYIKCLMEEYADLSFIERTRIVRKKSYDEINRAIAEKKLLRICVPGLNGTESCYCVYPYRIVTDQMKTRDYLVCFSRDLSSENSPKICASFSMIRLADSSIRKHGGTFHLTKEDAAFLDQEVKEKTPGYLLGKSDETIKVKLTAMGKQIYQNKLFSRPEKDHALSSEYEYVFHCSEKQAYDYFFSFGKEVEIISPASLRKRVMETHKEALDVYTCTNSSANISR